MKTHVIRTEGDSALNTPNVYAIGLSAKRTAYAACLALLLLIASLSVLVGSAAAAPVLLEHGNVMPIGDTCSSCHCPLAQSKFMSSEDEQRFNRLSPGPFCHPHYGE